MIEMNEADGLSQDLVTTQIARVAKRDAKILKIAAGVIAVGSVVNGWIAATNDDNFYSNTSNDISLKWRIAQFLSSALWTLGWAALILAAGFAIEIVALRATRLSSPSGPPHHTPASAPSAEPTTFAARPAPVVPPTRSSPPPPMKIANDEDIWRR